MFPKSSRKGTLERANLTSTKNFCAKRTASYFNARHGLRRSIRNSYGLYKYIIEEGPRSVNNRPPKGQKGFLFNLAARLNCIKVWLKCKALLFFNYSPITPSIASRIISAWPLWRAVSSIIWINIQRIVGSAPGLCASSSRLFSASILRDSATAS